MHVVLVHLLTVYLPNLVTHCSISHISLFFRAHSSCSSLCLLSFLTLLLCTRVPKPGLHLLFLQLLPPFQASESQIKHHFPRFSWLLKLLYISSIELILDLVADALLILGVWEEVGGKITSLYELTSPGLCILEQLF